MMSEEWKESYYNYLRSKGYVFTNFDELDVNEDYNLGRLYDDWWRKYHDVYFKDESKIAQWSENVWYWEKTETNFLSPSLKEALDAYDKTLKEQRDNMAEIRDQFHEYYRRPYQPEPPMFYDAIEQFFLSLQQLFQTEWQLIVERRLYIVCCVFCIVTILLGLFILDRMGYVTLY